MIKYLLFSVHVSECGLRVVFYFKPSYHATRTMLYMLCVHLRAIFVRLKIFRCSIQPKSWNTLGDGEWANLMFFKWANFVDVNTISVRVLLLICFYSFASFLFHSWIAVGLFRWYYEYTEKHTHTRTHIHIDLNWYKSHSFHPLRLFIYVCGFSEKEIIYCIHKHFEIIRCNTHTYTNSKPYPLRFFFFLALAFAINNIQILN